MGQEAQLYPPVVRMRTAAPLRSVGDRRVYARAYVRAQDGELVATPLVSQGSGSLTSMIDANGLAVIAEGVTQVDAGTELPVLLIGPIAS